MQKLLDLKNLTQNETYELFSRFSEYDAKKQSAILTLLRVKKETTEEILGAFQYFNQYVTDIHHDVEVVDIVGTGGDGAGTFNISTAASLVIASSGALVAKHGGRRSTSQVGSQDVIQALGIPIPQTGDDCIRNLRETNYTYLYAPLFNEGLKQYGPLRKKLGFPSIFNILGPLLNPMRPKRCVLGVYRKDLMQKVTEVLKLQGVKHALIVHSEDGLDEISISSNTHVVEIKEGIVEKYDLYPEQFGLFQSSSF